MRFLPPEVPSRRSGIDDTCQSSWPPGCSCISSGMGVDCCVGIPDGDDNGGGGGDGDASCVRPTNKKTLTLVLREENSRFREVKRSPSRTTQKPTRPHRFPAAWRGDHSRAGLALLLTAGLGCGRRCWFAGVSGPAPELLLPQRRGITRMRSDKGLTPAFASSRDVRSRGVGVLAR